MSLSHALRLKAAQRIQSAKKAAGVTGTRHKSADPRHSTAIAYEVIEDRPDQTHIVFHTKALPKGRPRLCVNREKLRVAITNRDMTLALSAFTVVTPKKTALYEKALRTAFAQVMLIHNRAVCDKDMGVSIIVAHKNAVYGDLDNQQKAILDAMNGVIFTDDKKVSDLHAKRISGQEDSFRVSLYWP